MSGVCDELLPILGLYAEGELPDASTVEIVRRHVRRCSRCSVRLSRWDALTRLMLAEEAAGPLDDVLGDMVASERRVDAVMERLCGLSGVSTASAPEVSVAFRQHPPAQAEPSFALLGTEGDVSSIAARVDVESQLRRALDELERNPDDGARARARGVPVVSPWRRRILSVMAAAAAAAALFLLPLDGGRRSAPLNEPVGQAVVVPGGSLAVASPVVDTGGEHRWILVGPPLNDSDPRPPAATPVSRRFSPVGLAGHEWVVEISFGVTDHSGRTTFALVPFGHATTSTALQPFRALRAFRRTSTMAVLQARGSPGGESPGYRVVVFERKPVVSGYALDPAASQRSAAAPLLFHDFWQSAPKHRRHAAVSPTPVTFPVVGDLR